MRPIPANRPTDTDAGNTAYIGRFAPSPTGPLHFGSLIAAVGSYLEARVHGGQWLLRIEDVDAPRTVPGASDAILRQLAGLGFQWDGEIVFQSRRLDRYQEVLDTLIRADKVFACACTRRELADSALAPDGSRRYPGTCRNGLRPGQTPRAWRLRTHSGQIRWHDAVQGPQAEDVGELVGDFVLLRADGQFAYQLAVVIDDADRGINHVVRGADLLGSTARQIFLHAELGIRPPAYTHLPVATNAAGEKLSKQTLAQAIDLRRPALALFRALEFLGQAPPAALMRADLAALWAWSHENWSLRQVPRCTAAPAPAEMQHNPQD